MTDPQIALLMLGLFLGAVMFGFPIAYTLMAMGIGFGYYAYFDADRMWRSFYRALRNEADTFTQVQTWIEGLFNNRIFDLFINQTYTVMSNEVLTAVPLFLFMGYLVERANIVDRLFYAEYFCEKPPWFDGIAAHYLRVVRNSYRNRGCSGNSDGVVGDARRYNTSLRQESSARERRGFDSSFDHVDRLCSSLRNFNCTSLRRGATPWFHVGGSLPSLCGGALSYSTRVCTKAKQG